MYVVKKRNKVRLNNPFKGSLLNQFRLDRKKVSDNTLLYNTIIYVIINIIAERLFIITKLNKFIDKNLSRKI